MNNTAVKPLPPPLPATTEELLAQRKLKTRRTLNDMVEDVHLALYQDKKYKDFLYATYDEQAQEGSLSADNIMAAMLIRTKAKVMENDELAGQKLATISKALNIVMRRYGEGRKDRRNMLHGEVVPSENDE